MKCALCGFEFEEEQEQCGKCPLNRTCDLIRCPNCGYSMLRGESSLIRFFKRLLHKDDVKWNR